MTESRQEYLRSIELRLLRCTFSNENLDPNPSPHRASSHGPRRIIDDIVVSIERGNYVGALNSDASRRVFRFAESWVFEDSVGSADEFYNEVERSVEAFLRAGVEAEAWMGVLENDEGDMDCEEEDMGCRVVMVMCVAVAAVLAFAQRNMTGPAGEFSSFPLSFPQAETMKKIDGGGKWDMWARNMLMSSGSDLFGKFPMIQYIVYAKSLLSKITDLCMNGKNSYLGGSKSISWWLLRILLLEQRVLDELSSSLYELLSKFVNETLQQFGSLGSVSSYWGSLLCDGESLTIVSVVHLEAGVMESIFGRVDSARIHFSNSEWASGLNLSLSGALGYRTVHQVDAKVQMVLLDTDSQEREKRTLIKCSKTQREDCDMEYQNNCPSFEKHDQCDILMAPKLVESHNNDICDGNITQNDVSTTKPLSSIQQAVVLAQCLHINRSNPDDELSRWKVAPFIEAVDAQEHSHFIIQCFCDILRIRWESSRSRTKERAYMMMTKLVEHAQNTHPHVDQRIQFCFAVHFPTIPALQKEYGELSLGCGLVGEALKIFEELELWNNIIYCYRLLEKKSAAVNLIRARLVDMPSDPKLWCSLGDVTNTDSYYEKALEVSGNRSARAKRSLARSAYNRGDYVKSKVLWESALSLNSLYPDGWFALGAAALKSRDLDKALDGFSRAVQLDPENGEAWSNIAHLHMLRKRSKLSYIAFKEALKFRRGSWQLWQSFGHVAMDLGHLRQALEAIKMVLDLTANKQIDVELLDRILVEVEIISNIESTGESCETDSGGESRSGLERTSQAEVLVESLGNVLHQIVRNDGQSVWGLYARWHRIKGDLNMCSEALLKQVRSLQGSDLWHDEGRFKKFSQASLELCDVYIKIASSTGSHRELNAAEMHLKSTMKQASKFSNTEEFGLLQACLDEVRKCIDAFSIENTSL